MSTRLYPLYQKGNPQLRIFLPNFFMKMIKPLDGQPPNRLKFIVSKEMSKYDVSNYLTKIYGVNVAEVHTHVAQGRFKKSGRGVVIKEDDFKIAYVTLPMGETFTFPQLYPEKKEEEELEEAKKTRENMTEVHKEIQKINKRRPDVPTWFSF